MKHFLSTATTPKRNALNRWAEIESKNWLNPTNRTDFIIRQTQLLSNSVVDKSSWQQKPRMAAHTIRISRMIACLFAYFAYVYLWLQSGAWLHYNIICIHYIPSTCDVNGELSIRNSEAQFCFIDWSMVVIVLISGRSSLFDCQMCEPYECDTCERYVARSNERITNKRGWLSTFPWRNAFVFAML